MLYNIKFYYFLNNIIVICSIKEKILFNLKIINFINFIGNLYN